MAALRLVTKNIIRRIFQDIATAHYQINSFGYGDAADYVQKTMDEDTQTLEGRTIYPRLFVEPIQSNITGKRYKRGYNVFVADLVRKGDNNETETESDTEQILLDVIALIQNQEYGFLLDVNNISIDPFKERFADEVTGHWATVTLDVGFEFNRCQVPSSFISISNPYIPLDEQGTNERDPLSWHWQGNDFNFEAYLGTTSQQGFRIGTGSITRWRFQLEGHFVPNASGVYDIGTSDLPVRHLYALNINGSPVPVAPIIFTKTGVTDSMQDDRLIGGNIDNLFLFQAGTELVSAQVVSDYDTLTGTVTFIADLGGSDVRVQLFQ